MHSVVLHKCYEAVLFHHYGIQCVRQGYSRCMESEVVIKLQTNENVTPPTLRATTNNTSSPG